MDKLMFDKGRTEGLAMENLNINQFINELTQWFDFSVGMMSHHPFISLTVALAAFVFYYAVSAVKFTLAIISFGLAMITAFLLEMLMF